MQCCSNRFVGRAHKTCGPERKLDCDATVDRQGQILCKVKAISSLHVLHVIAMATTKPQLVQSVKLSNVIVDSLFARLGVIITRTLIRKYVRDLRSTYIWPVSLLHCIIHGLAVLHHS
jgi:hypothetical protein